MANQYNYDPDIGHYNLSEFEKNIPEDDKVYLPWPVETPKKLAAPFAPGMQPQPEEEPGFWEKIGKGLGAAWLGSNGWLFSDTQKDVENLSNVTNAIKKAEVLNWAAKNGRDIGIQSDPTKFKFNEPIRFDDLTNGIATGQLRSEPNGKGGFDIYRTYATPDGNEPRELLPIYEISRDGKFFPVHYYQNNIQTPITPGAKAGFTIPNQQYSSTNPLTEEELTKRARSYTPQGLNEQPVFWKAAMENPIAKVFDRARSVISGEHYANPDLMLKAEPGSDYESAKQWGETANSMATGIAGALAGGAVGAGTTAMALGMGAMGVPDYLADYSMGNLNFRQTLAKIGIDEASSMAIMKFAGPLGPKGINKILDAIKNETNPGWKLIQQLSLQVMKQQPFIAAQSLLQQGVDQGGTGRFDTNEMIRNVALQMMLQATTGLVMDFAMQGSNLAGQISTGKATNKTIKLTNWISENWNKPIEGATEGMKFADHNEAIAYSVEQFNKAKSSGELDAWNQKLIARMQEAGLIKNTNDLKNARQIIDNISKLNMILDPGGNYRYVMGEDGNMQVENVSIAKAEKKANAETTGAPEEDVKVTTADDRNAFNQAMSAEIGDDAALQQKLIDAGIGQKDKLIVGGKSRDIVTYGRDNNNTALDGYEKASKMYEAVAGEDFTAALKENPGLAVQRLLNIIDGHEGKAIVGDQSVNDRIVESQGLLDPAQTEIDRAVQKNELSTLFNGFVDNLVKKEGISPIQAMNVVKHVFGLGDKTASSQLRQKFIDKYTTTPEALENLQEQFDLAITGPTTEIKPQQTGVPKAWEGLFDKANSKASEALKRAKSKQQSKTQEQPPPVIEEPIPELPLAESLPSKKKITIPSEPKPQEIAPPQPLEQSAIAGEPSPNPEILSDPLTPLPEAPITETAPTLTASERATIVNAEQGHAGLIPRYNSETDAIMPGQYTALLEGEPAFVAKVANKGWIVTQIRPDGTNSSESFKTLKDAGDYIVNRNQEWAKTKTAPTVVEHPISEATAKLDAVPPAELSKVIVREPEYAQAMHDEHQSLNAMIEEAKIPDAPEPMATEADATPPPTKAKSEKIKQRATYEAMKQQLKSMEQELKTSGLMKGGILVEPDDPVAAKGATAKIAQYENLYRRIKAYERKQDAYAALKTYGPPLVVGTINELFNNDDEKKNIIRAGVMMGIPGFHGLVKFKTNLRTYVSPEWLHPYLRNEVPTKTTLLDAGKVPSVPEKRMVDIKNNKRYPLWDAKFEESLAKSDYFQEQVKLGKSYQSIMDDLYALDRHWRRLVLQGPTIKNRLLYKANPTMDFAPYDRLVIEGKRGNGVYHANYGAVIEARQRMLYANTTKTERIIMAMANNQLHREEVRLKNLYDYNRAKAGSTGKVELDAQLLSDMAHLNDPKTIQEYISNLNSIPKESKVWKEDISPAMAASLAEKYQSVWRPWINEVNRAGYHAALSKASGGVHPDEFANIKASVAAGVEEARALRKELTKLYQQEKKLTGVKGAEGKRIMGEIKNIRKQIADLKMRYDGLDISALQAQNRIFENIDMKILESQSGHYLDKRVLFNGDIADDKPYMLKIVEVQTTPSKLRVIRDTQAGGYKELVKIDNQLAKLEGRTDPESIARIKKLTAEKNRTEKKIEKLNVSRENFIDKMQMSVEDQPWAYKDDVHWTKTDQLFAYRFKSSMERRQFLTQLKKDRNAIKVELPGSKPTDPTILEMDARDSFNRPILNPDGSVKRVTVRFDDGINTKNIPLKAMISQEQIRGMLYELLPEAQKSGDWKNMQQQINKLMEDTKTWKADPEEGSTEYIQDQLKFLQNAFATNSHAQVIDAFHDVLNNMSRFRAPNYHRNKNFIGWEPRTASEWQNYINRMPEILSETAKRDFETAMFIREVDKQLEHISRMGLTNNPHYQKLLELRKRYYSDHQSHFADLLKEMTIPIKIKLPEKSMFGDWAGKTIVDTRGYSAADFLDDIGRFQVFKVLGYALSPSITNITYGFDDMMLTHPKGVGHLVGDLSRNALPIGKNLIKQTELSLGKLLSVKFKRTQPLGEALIRHAEKNGFRPYREPANAEKIVFTNKDGGAAAIESKNKLYNDITQDLMARKPGGDSFTQSMISGIRGGTVGKLAWTPQKIAEFILRTGSSMSRIPSLVKYNKPLPGQTPAEYTSMIADMAEAYMSASQGQYTPMFAASWEHAVMSNPIGRLFLKLTRPFLHHTFNVFQQAKFMFRPSGGDYRIELMNKKYNPDLATSDIVQNADYQSFWSKFASRGVPLEKLAAYGVIGFLTAGIKGIWDMQDILDMYTAGRKAWDKLTGQEKDPTLVNETTDDQIQRLVRQYFHEQLGWSDEQTNKMITLFSSGVPGMYGVAMNKSENMSGFLQPFYVQSWYNDIKKIVGSENAEMMAWNSAALLMPVQLRKAVEAGFQRYYNSPMRPPNPYGQSKMEGRDFTYGDMVKYAIWGQPARDRLISDIRFRGTDLISPEGKRDYAKSVLNIVQKELAFGINQKFTGESQRVNTILDKTKIAENAPYLKDAIVKEYHSGKYEKAIQVSRAKLEQFLDANESKIRSIYLGTKIPIEQYGTDKKNKQFRQTLENTLERYYQDEAVREVLKGNNEKYFGQRIPMAHHRYTKSDRIKTLDNKWYPSIDAIPFEERGFYEALQTYYRGEKKVSGYTK